MAYLRYRLKDDSYLLVRADETDMVEDNGAYVLGPRWTFLKDAVVGLASAPPGTVRQLYQILRDTGVLPQTPELSAADIGNEVRKQLAVVGYSGARVRLVRLEDGVWLIGGIVEGESFEANVHPTGYVTSFRVGTAGMPAD